MPLHAQPLQAITDEFQEVVDYLKHGAEYVALIILLTPFTDQIICFVKQIIEDTDLVLCFITGTNIHLSSLSMLQKKQVLMLSFMIYQDYMKSK